MLTRTARNNEVNFDILFYRSPLPMLIFDVDSLRIVDVNDAALEFYGYTVEEFRNMTTRDLRVPQTRKDFDNLAPQFKTEDKIYVDAQHQKKSGEVVDLQIVSYLIEYEDKTYRLGQMHDVTTKVRQARNLEILISIGKSISEELDPKSVLQKVTDATTQLSGAEFGAFFYNLRNEQGEVFRMHTFSGVPPEACKELERFASTFHPTFSQVQLLRIDDVTKGPRFGKNFPHDNLRGQDLCLTSFMSVPVISKSREVVGCLLFGHRLTGVFSEEAEHMVVSVASQAAIALDNATLFEDLLQANKEKEELLRQAQEQNFKKDEFLSIASHELKTPVTSMKGYLQILTRQARKEENSAYATMVDNANRQVDKIVRLVDELLNLSKLESGKMVYNLADFAISEVIEDVITHFVNSRTSHSIRIFGDKSQQVYGDKNRLEQVIVNLIDNAIKYSPKATEVLVGLSQERGYFKLEVRDFGPGIPEEKLSLIFDRFYRGEENSFNTSGLGLGLYISSEIIRSHDGKMGVESEIGKGSNFWFMIPASSGA
ncbi:ATP-binding protein [Pedobacter sp. SYSU D00535]|uniref:sensor histidine kinase n=1 Tax=Pedobacter sp. SYSU D00535 TaxID=2810308 RepID=UPI001A95D8A5|nr:ATP-binding protein [Pedobacter sp. SYSU D00535]